MTLQERGRLGNAVMRQRAEERALALLSLLDQGECLKRAAHKAGVSYRTARRYRREWR